MSIIERPSVGKINLAEYRNKVYGCWAGKNIGGTLGAPFEGKQEINDIDFYTQPTGGEPCPNDDLDLQLIWLAVAEKYGIYNITPRLLGEFWVENIIGPWNEYATCCANIRNGFYPPLSGAINNDVWKYSNGAWIRSEIWACCFPGSPDEAIHFAYIDACADHDGEGVFAELFTAAVESAAFVESDIRELLEIGLAKIPADSRVARAVRLVMKMFDEKKDWQEARDALVEDSKDIGWFQAPANIGFAVIGLLYGNGDFGRSICLAVNCGDDTDCTAATVGAILGIIAGYDNIPEKWLKPIGDKIKTIAINPFGLHSLPSNIRDLTSRIIKIAEMAAMENPSLPQISNARTCIDTCKYKDSTEAERIWKYSPYELTFDLPYAELTVMYEKAPIIKEGEEFALKLRISMLKSSMTEVDFRWHLPEGWTSRTASAKVHAVNYSSPCIAMPFVPGAIKNSIEYVLLEVKLVDRNNSFFVNIPFQAENSTDYKRHIGFEPYERIAKRLSARVRNALDM
jgi:ADP-ribosylglycohydrolase